REEAPARGRDLDPCDASVVGIDSALHESPLLEPADGSRDGGRLHALDGRELTEGEGPVPLDGRERGELRWRRRRLALLPQPAGQAGDRQSQAGGKGRCRNRVLPWWCSRSCARHLCKDKLLSLSKYFGPFQGSLFAA